MAAKTYVYEFGMGVDVHGKDSTKAAKRAVSDAIRHSSLAFFAEARERGAKMVVHVMVGVPNPETVDIAAVRNELPYGEVTVEATLGGVVSPLGDALIACVILTVGIEEPG